MEYILKEEEYKYLKSIEEKYTKIEEGLFEQIKKEYEDSNKQLDFYVYHDLYTKLFSHINTFLKLPIWQRTKKNWVLVTIDRLL